MAFCLVHVPVASAGVLFSDGFESGDFSAWSLVKTRGDGTAAVQSQIVNTGTFAARFTETSNLGSKAYARETFGAAQTDLTVSGAFYVAKQGASGGNVPLFRLLDPTLTRLVSVYRQNGTSGRIGVSYGGTYFSTSGKLALGTWGTVSVHVVVAGAGGSITVMLNGTSVYQATANFGSSGIATMQIGNATAHQAGSVVVDTVTAESGTDPPVETTPPSISGTPQQRQTLTGSPGTWSNSPTSYTYGWNRCAVGGSCSQITGFGPNNEQYMVQAADVGYQLQLAVQACNASGCTKAWSAKTAIVTSSSWPTPAPYPSRLHQCGRQICDANGYALPMLKGFDVEVHNRPQSDWDAMAAKGANFARIVVAWNALEPTQGSFSSTYAAELDHTIAQAQADHIYLELELHINGGNNWPSWTGTSQGHMSLLMQDGEGVVKFLANRYGNPSSPEYTPAVMGFGLNEPPVDNSHTSSVWPTLESQERTVASWMRSNGDAPEWIYFAAGPWASATPIFNLACAGEQGKQDAYTPASTTAYDSVGGNVVMDVHAYTEGTTTATIGYDGRSAIGENEDYTNGGKVVRVGDSTPSQYPSPHNGTTNTTVLLSQMVAWVCPYATYAAEYDGGRGLPIMFGEFGWTIGSSTTMLQAGTGYAAYESDLLAALATADPAIESEWDFSHAQANGQDPWAAMPSINGTRTWQPFTDWMSAP